MASYVQKNLIKFLVKILFTLISLPAFAGTSTLTANGTFTVPAGVTSIKVTVNGAGGGGGGADSGGGGNGGNGQRIVTKIPVTPGQLLAVAVGTGGRRGGTAGTSYSSCTTNAAGGTSTAAAGGQGGRSGCTGWSGMGGGGGGATTVRDGTSNTLYIFSAGGGGGAGGTNANATRVGVAGAAGGNILNTCTPTVGSAGANFGSGDGAGGGGAGGSCTTTTGGVGNNDTGASTQTSPSIAQGYCIPNIASQVVTCTNTTGGGAAGGAGAADGAFANYNATLGGSDGSVIFEWVDVTIRKISNTQTGTFAFTSTNMNSPANITTTTAGAAATGSTQNLFDSAATTTVTDNNAGWTLSSASCVNNTSGGPAFSASNLTMANNVLTISSGGMVDGNSYSCTLVNNLGPYLRVQKTSFIEKDPINGANNPKSIPGAWRIYTIKVSNEGKASPDANLAISETLPSNVDLYVNGYSGSSPAAFNSAANGNASGTTLTFTSLSSTTDDYDFYDASNTSITPVADADGFSSAVRRVVFNVKGQMQHNNGNTPYPAFSITFRVRVK